MSKIIKNILPIALPLAAVAMPFAAPGLMASLGTALGAGAGSAGMLGSGLTSAALSGAGSAIQGKPVGSSLLSAGLGGLGGALAGGGGSAISSGLGLSGTGANALSGALTGAAYGGATGGGEGALLGAAGGGLTGGLLGSGGSSGGIDFGSATELAGTPAASLGSAATPAVDFGSLTTGTGLAAGGGASSMTGAGMKLSDVLKLGGSLYSGYSSSQALDEQNKAIKNALTQAQGTLSPYTQAGATAIGQLSDALSQGFNYEDYANTPAYQFQLGEGQNAITSALAAQGLGQSGAAVKEAAQYATNLANQNYNDAYNQWLQKNSQLASLGGLGSGAATNMANLYGYGGETAANLIASKEDAQNKMLLALLSGMGSIYA